MTDKKIDFEQNKIELEKMRQVSELISEVKPYFLEKRKRERKALRNLKVACLGVAFMFLSFGTIMVNQEFDIINSIVYHDISIEEMGFPTDEYGLIAVY